ncbi:MAG: hypothetical protein K2N94_16205, partial [Lachnospiraceae bacterium]|nr:hypothetical protein [Lachnospiraceae bacterium]
MKVAHFLFFIALIKAFRSFSIQLVVDLKAVRHFQRIHQPFDDAFQDACTQDGQHQAPHRAHCMRKAAPSGGLGDDKGGQIDARPGKCDIDGHAEHLRKKCRRRVLQLLSGDPADIAPHGAVGLFDVLSVFLLRAFFLLLLLLRSFFLFAFLLFAFLLQAFLLFAFLLQAFLLFASLLRGLPSR